MRLVRHPEYRIPRHQPELMTHREEILGAGLFEVFPDDPRPPASATCAPRWTGCGATGCPTRWWCRSTTSAVPPSRRPAAKGGGFEVRYWSPLNAPVLADDGELACN
jgi:hypothetical protein